MDIYVCEWVGGWSRVGCERWRVGLDEEDDGSFKVFGVGDLDKCCYEFGRNK